MTAVDPQGAAVAGRGPALDPAEVRDWIFDLDNTLYPAACQLFVQVDARINSFIQDYLALDPGAARALQRRYFEAHGSSLAGLMLHHGLDPAEYLAFVHEIDLGVLLPSPELDAALAALPGRKLIYTNGSTRHAERVLARLGIAGHFAEIFDIAAADYRPKPRAEPMSALVERHGIAPRSAVFVEDLARNLAPAAALGMTTVLVTAAPAVEAPEDFIDHVTDDLAAWLGALTMR